jgi:hypothetical protein
MFAWRSPGSLGWVLFQLSKECATAKPNPSYSIARRIMVPTSPFLSQHLEWQHPVERVFVRCPGFQKILV